MARLPKDLFSKFQEHLSNEQELREVRVRTNQNKLNENLQIQYQIIEVISIMFIFIRLPQFLLDFAGNTNNHEGNRCFGA